MRNSYLSTAIPRGKGFGGQLASAIRIAAPAVCLAMVVCAAPWAMAQTYKQVPMERGKTALS